MSKKKKIIILTSMIALLVMTGYLNVALNNNLSQNVNSTVTESFYVGFRNTRENARNKEIILYNSIINSTTALAENKRNAEVSMKALIAQMEREVAIEGLICSRGFQDAVYTQTDNYINVVVNAKTLLSSQVAQITKIIMEQTGLGIDNITINSSAE